MAPPLKATVLAASAMLMIVSGLAESAELPSHSSIADVFVPLHRSDSLYTMQFRINDITVSGIADTGSDLIWMNNPQLLESAPVSCPPKAGEEMDMTCCHGLSTFERKYGNGNGAVVVPGVMGRASLTFGDQKSHYTTPPLDIGSAIKFGCHININSKDCKTYLRGGIVGLGRGSMSLVSQLRLHSFSYNIPRLSCSASGQMKFNDAAAPLKNAQTTKLEIIEGLEYPKSSNYYVGLKEIQVGSTNSPVVLPNGCLEENRSTGDGGMVIDSGTSFTHLPEAAFNAVRKKVEELIEHKTGAKPKPKPKEVDHACYLGSCPDGLDSLILHFCDNAQTEMEIPAENYIFIEKDGKEEGVFCLAFNKLQAGGKDGRKSILGAYQQQGMHMLFDIEHNTLSFAKHIKCSESQEENHATM